MKKVSIFFVIVGAILFSVGIIRFVDFVLNQPSDDIVFIGGFYSAQEENGRKYITFVPFKDQGDGVERNLPYYTVYFDEDVEDIFGAPWEEIKNWTVLRNSPDCFLTTFKIKTKKPGIRTKGEIISTRHTERDAMYPPLSAFN